MAFAYSRKLKTGTFWYVRHLGKTHAAGRSRDVAKRIASKLEDKARLATFGIEDPGRCSWSLDHLFKRVESWARANRPASLDFRLGHFRRLLEYFGPEALVEQVTRSRIDEYCSNPPGKAGPASINRAMAVLRHALGMARSWGNESRYARNPFAGWTAIDESKTRRAAVALPRRAIRKLMRTATRLVYEAPPHLRDRRQEDADIVALYLLTGSRREEILAMRRSQISSECLTFPPRKRGRARRFALTAELRTILSRHEGPGDWVFPTMNGNGPRRDLRRFWATLTKEAGFPELRIHDLRHTAITERVRKGGVLAGQALAGHRTPEMVHRIYTHLHDELLKPLEVRATQVQQPTRKIGTGRKMRNREIIENTKGP